MFRQNHSFVVDFFGLGMLLYELMMNKSPYKKSNRDELANEMISNPVIIKKSDIPKGWSREAADFVTKVFIII